MMPWILDALVIVALGSLALAVLHGRGEFAAVVWFIAFGVMVSLAWVRLGAIDVALAEAAIGAGLTGAMLLRAWGALSDESSPPPPGQKEAGDD